MVVSLSLALIAGQAIDLPAGLYTLGEVVDKAKEVGLDVTAAASEHDRVFAARLMSVDPLVALKSVTEAAGDLEIREEKKDDKVVYTVQPDQTARAKNDALAARLFNELLADYRKNLADTRAAARSVVGMRIEERQPIARQLQAEYDFIYEEWNKDRANKLLREKLKRLSIPLRVHTLAGEEWAAFPLEALWSIQGQMPRSFRAAEQWQLRLSGVTGGAALVQALQQNAPEGTQVLDVVTECRLGVMPDYITLSARVFPILEDEVASVYAPVEGQIELRDCLRPALKYHFEKKCAHFTDEPFTPPVVSLPEGADAGVAFKDIGQPVMNLSRAALLWADFAKRNLVCELVPAAEFISEQPEEGQRVSLADLMGHTNRWTLESQDGVFVLDCDTRVVDVIRAPIKAARDAGLLPWRKVDRTPAVPLKGAIQYGRAALAHGGVWSPRGRDDLLMDFYAGTYDLDAIPFNVGIADALGLIDDDGGLSVGVFPISQANRARLRTAYDYITRSLSREESRHPRVFETLCTESFYVEKVRNREWMHFGTRVQGKLVRSLFRSTYYLPTANTLYSLPIHHQLAVHQVPEEATPVPLVARGANLLDGQK